MTRASNEVGQVICLFARFRIPWPYREIASQRARRPKIAHSFAETPAKHHREPSRWLPLVRFGILVRQLASIQIASSRSLDSELFYVKESELSSHTISAPQCLMGRSFQQLIGDLRNGDANAAVRIVDEYTARLVHVAQRQISPALRRRVDPEDVIQSVYRSFFVRMREGEFELGTGEDLWKLLVTLTLNKMRKQFRYHRAARRSLEREQFDEPGEFSPSELAASDEPSPQDAAMLVEQVRSILATVRERDRPILELRLRGYTSPEIAKETNRAERSVRRVLQLAREKLQQLIDREKTY